MTRRNPPAWEGLLGDINNMASDSTRGTTYLERQGFVSVCGNATSSYALLTKSLEELYQLKDELLKYALPSKLLMRITLVISQIMRSQSDLYVPLSELVRTVQVYSDSWQGKSETLKVIHEQQESKQHQLSIALKKIEILSSESERYQQEKTTNKWAGLFSKVLVNKTHGRRWKFRIEAFKRNARDGFSKFNPFAMSGGSEPVKLKVKQPVKPAKKVVDIHLANKSAPLKAAMPPKPPTHTVGTSTRDPGHNYQLLVRLYQPHNTVSGADAVCAVKFKSEVHVSKPFPSSKEVKFQDFHLDLTESDVGQMRVPTLFGGTETKFGCRPLRNKATSITISVHPEILSNDAMATSEIKMSSVKLEGPPTVLVPSTDRSEEFDIGWQYISSVFKEEDAHNYRCTGKVPSEMKVLFHLVCVQKLRQHHFGTSTVSFEECLTNMGYRGAVQLKSRSTSAKRLALSERGTVTSMIWGNDKDSSSIDCDTKSSAVLMDPEEDKVSAEELAKVMLKHTQELESLQNQYEEKLVNLSRSIEQLKWEKQLQEKAFKEHENHLLSQLQSQQMDTRQSVQSVRQVQQQSVKRDLQGLPNDFFERLEWFARESLRKQAALTQRIKKEIADVCEQQLLVQHRLDIPRLSGVEASLTDVCLPALFMPTPLGHLYTPRAHMYFHPTGVTRDRIAQPPTIFKLPHLSATQTGTATVNLFDLSQKFTSLTDPDKEIPRATRKHSKSKLY